MKLPKEKQTNLGLYITSKEAYQIWQDTPRKVKILDVRTIDEYINIGHAAMAGIVTKCSFCCQKGATLQLYKHCLSRISTGIDISEQ